MTWKLLAVELEQDQEWLLETPCVLVVTDPWGETARFKGIIRQTEGVFTVQGTPAAVAKFKALAKGLTIINGSVGQDQ